MLSKVVVLGKFGQLSQSIQDNDPEQSFIYLSSTDLDLRNTKEISKKLKEINPSIIINCSAYNNVDDAERLDSDNILINEMAVKEVVKFCKKNKSKFIHVSTDYVFDGKKQSPYHEDDLAFPVNEYGKAKLEAEKFIAKNLQQFFILRTSWLYSHFKTENNFLNKIISAMRDKKQLFGATDLIGTPTYSSDLARHILEIIQKDEWHKSGIFHATNTGAVSRFDFIKKIIELSNVYLNNVVDVSPSQSSEFSQQARRPIFTAMSNIKLQEKLGIQTRDWEVSLDEAINLYFSNA